MEVKRMEVSLESNVNDIFDRIDRSQQSSFMHISNIENLVSKMSIQIEKFGAGNMKRRYEGSIGVEIGKMNVETLALGSRNHDFDHELEKVEVAHNVFDEIPKKNFGIFRKSFDEMSKANIGDGNKVFNELPNGKVNFTSGGWFHELNGLKQISSVKEYHDCFIDVLSRLQLPQKYSLSCFIDGLNEDIRCMVKLFKPKTIHEAYCLAKLHEATLEARKPNELIRKPPLPTQNIPIEEHLEELNKSVEFFSMDKYSHECLQPDAHTRIHTRDQYGEILIAENGMGRKELMENHDENIVDATTKTGNEDVKDTQDVSCNAKNKELELELPDMKNAEKENEDNCIEGSGETLKRYVGYNLLTYGEQIIYQCCSDKMIKTEQRGVTGCALNELLQVTCYLRSNTLQLLWDTSWMQGIYSPLKNNDSHEKKDVSLAKKQAGINGIEKACLEVVIQNILTRQSSGDFSVVESFVWKPGSQSWSKLLKAIKVREGFVQANMDTKFHHNNERFNFLCTCANLLHQYNEIAGSNLLFTFTVFCNQHVKLESSWRNHYQNCYLMVPSLFSTSIASHKPRIILEAETSVNLRMGSSKLNHSFIQYLGSHEQKEMITRGILLMLIENIILVFVLYNWKNKKRSTLKREDNQRLKDSLMLSETATSKDAYLAHQQLMNVEQFLHNCIFLVGTAKAEVAGSLQHGYSFGGFYDVSIVIISFQNRKTPTTRAFSYILRIKFADFFRSQLMHIMFTIWSEMAATWDMTKSMIKNRNEILKVEKDWKAYGIHIPVPTVQVNYQMLNVCILLIYDDDSRDIEKMDVVSPCSTISSRSISTISKSSSNFQLMKLCDLHINSPAMKLLRGLFTSDSENHVEPNVAMDLSFQFTLSTLKNEELVNSRLKGTLLTDKRGPYLWLRCNKAEIQGKEASVA